jgi:glucan phosphoethanolaminetransferase (alkaline phosphatase superfamily)
MLACYCYKALFYKVTTNYTQALDVGKITPELESERAKLTPTFTHYLDISMLFLIIALGVLKPETWTVFFYGAAISIAVATIFTIVIPRMYPWGEKSND